MARGPTSRYENAARKRGLLRVAGVDEVGRGPWAGPVAAAAVVLDPANIPKGLDDSKKLSPKRREALFAQLMASAEVSIGQATVAEIEAHNILQASHMAMVRALRGLPSPPDHVLIDGNRIPHGMNLSAEPLVKGDTRSISIAAASIVAKVWRDRLMVDLAQQHPQYGWETNAGYGVPKHLAALQKYGVTPHHRRTFRPIHNILWQDKILSD